MFSRDNSPYIDFTPPKAETFRESLTLSEVEKLENWLPEPEDAHLGRICQMFVFGCYTGLRISDLTQLKQENLQIDENKMTLRVKMHKTRKRGKWVSLPLHNLYSGKPKQIVESLLKDKNSSPFLFKPLTSEYIRRQLKEIARLVGIQKKITPHTARHTFGALGAEFIKDLTLLKELMGHSKIETTMVYAEAV